MVSNIFSSSAVVVGAQVQSVHPACFSFESSVPQFHPVKWWIRQTKGSQSSLLFLSSQLLNANLTFYLSSSYQTLCSGCAGERDKDHQMERDFTMNELLVLVPDVLESILGGP